MARIEVEPAALEGGASTAAQLAGGLSAMRGQLQAVAGQVEDGLADGGAGGAAVDALTAWAAALDGLAMSSTSLGANLEGAASGYVHTDATAIDGE